jgi:hypothetical protein
MRNRWSVCLPHETQRLNVEGSLRMRHDEDIFGTSEVT